MSQPSPFQSPTTTGRSSAWLSLLTTQTKWPFALCCTARCGTTIAFGRIAPVQAHADVLVRAQHARRIVDGRAQQERARRRVVRRVRERDRARCTGRDCRRPSRPRRRSWPPSGSLSCPLRTSLRMRSISFSETLKLIHIGVSTETVVSCAFCGLRYVPSATAA